MKLTHVLPLAALGSAFVLPPQEVLAEISFEDNRGSNDWYHDAVDTKDEAIADLHGKFDEAKVNSQNAWNHAAQSSKDAFDEAVESAETLWDELYQNAEETYDEVTETSKSSWESLRKSIKEAASDVYQYTDGAADQLRDTAQDTAFNAKSWLTSQADSFMDLMEEGHDDPHHGPPNHDHPPHPPHPPKPPHPPHPPHPPRPPHHDDPHHGKPGKGRRPHHPPHHGKPNLTVYQMIAESKYTTRLAKLINEFDDLVEALNSTKANYTVFAPTDKAFEKIPDKAPKPSKEVLKAILSYHVVPDFYPAGRVFRSRTAPTLLKGDHLSSQPELQRIAFKLGFGGLSINFYSRVIAPNIFGTNGVIHGVDSILLPPPRAVQIIDLLPGEFSTLELGLTKTGLLDKLNTTDHAGGTIFAPSNFAFKKLGPKINAFLFSQYGLKYLKALLEYHVVPDNTLYSDAYYKAKTDSSELEPTDNGYFHVDLPTLLKDRKLAVDVARYSRFISMKINAFSRVTVSDGIAEDGVIHVVSDVLVPPKSIGGRLGAAEYWDGSELSVEDLKERLEPFVNDVKFDL